MQFPNLKYPRGASAPKKATLHILDKLARFLKKQRRVSVVIIGHTDNKGGRDYNIKLSEGRAEFFRRYLINLGISANKLEVKGAGPDHPLFSNKTAKGRARNRRVELRLYRVTD